MLARREPSHTHTYGLKRGTILAALANAVLLLVAVGAISGIVYGALQLRHQRSTIDAVEVAALAVRSLRA